MSHLHSSPSFSLYFFTLYFRLLLFRHEKACDANDVKPFIAVHLVIDLLSRGIQKVRHVAVGMIESLVIAAFKLEAPISVNINARNTCERKMASVLSRF